LSKFGIRGQALGSEEWQVLRSEVLELFTPGAPVDEFTLFAGRQAQLQKLRDTLDSRGRHAVVFGERGVGKTSLVSIFHHDHIRLSRIHRIYVQCSKADEFHDMWIKAFKRIRFDIDGEKVYADDMVERVEGPDDVDLVLSHFASNDIPIVIFDEFDRV
jgi:predicted ATPase